MRIADEYREYIIRPVLRDLELWSESAEVLVLGTAAKESMGFSHIHQMGSGPALSPWQIEPDTYHDLLMHTLPGLHRTKPKTVAAYQAMVPKQYVTWPPATHLLRDLGFACATARLLFWRAPGALPAPDDLDGMAAYWKRFYNTSAGAGTTGEWLDWWHRCCA